MKVITYQHSGAYFIQVQSIQKKGLRYTLHSSTNFIQGKIKVGSKFHHHQSKRRKNQKEIKENIHIHEKVWSIKSY